MDLRKNQHYVPKFYFKEWCIPNTNQVYVYDKSKKEVRISNIEKIASENYFYDYNLADFFPEETIHAFNSSGLAAKGKLQIIERMFSDRLEGPFSSFFSDIICKARNSTPWIRRECYFITSEMKEAISVYLAFQFFRTKAIRTHLTSSAERITSFCKELGVPDNLIEEITLSKSAANRIHNRMLLDQENILKSAYLFHRLIWILGINRTDKCFYTSDNPISLRGHAKRTSPFIQGTGLASAGVEIFYPLAPDLILVMMDGDYHKHLVNDERRYVEFGEIPTIEYYNSLAAMNSERFVISSNDDFALLNS